MLECQDCGVLFDKKPGPGRNPKRCEDCKPRRTLERVSACLRCGGPMGATGKQFCSPLCRNKAKRKPDIECIGCGAMFRPRHDSKGYCSRGCAVVNFDRRRERECAECGARFKGGYRESYCSEVCDRLIKGDRAAGSQLLLVG